MLSVVFCASSVKCPDHAAPPPDVSCDLLEKGRVPGGRAQTRTQEGFLFNRGPHARYRAGLGIENLREMDIPF